MKKTISITLSNDEIIVLSDLFYRINSSDVLNDFFADQAEQRALWNLESILEKNTADIFSGDYLNNLKQSRDNLRDAE